MQSYWELSDYRRQVSDLYAAVRAESGDPQAAWDLWRRGRDRLLRGHPQSALPGDDRPVFSGLSYFPYNPELRQLAVLDDGVEHEVIEVPLEDDGLMRMVRVGQVEFVLSDTPEHLCLYWILGYGGGLFLPFKDATNGGETFGGGRYLLDGIKGADLGLEGGRLVLDFNFAYNPSCAYSPEWHCPLPPPENWLSIPVQAGEMAYPGPAPIRPA